MALLAATVASLTGLALVLGPRPGLGLVLLLGAVLIAANGLAGARLTATAPAPLAGSGQARGIVVIDQVPREAERGGWRVRGVSEDVRLAGGGALPSGARLLLDIAPDAGAPRLGERAHVSGRLRDAASAEAPVWWRRYLERQGIAARLGVERIEVVGRRGGVAGLLDAWREWAVRSAAAGLEGDRAALVRGMLLGSTDGLSPGTERAYRDAGIWHLLAVSGQNVTVVALAALMAMRLLGVARVPAGVAALAVVAGYCLACDPGPSVARAGLMGAVAIVGDLRSSPVARWHLLAVALAGLLVHQPRAIGDPGLQLSFAAVAGLFLMAEPLSARLAGVLPAKVADLAALAAAAGVATAPVVIWHFGRLSLVGLPLNVVAVPLAAPIVVLALCSLAVSALSHALAVALAWPAGVGAAASIGLARAAAGVPGATAELPRPAAALVGVGALAIWAGARRIPRARRLSGRPGAVALAATAAVAAIAVAASRPPAPAPWPDRPELRVLDVGQGDAVLLRSPGGEAALVDAGPPGSPAEAARALARLGVGPLAFVAITHPAVDHDGGLADVLAHPGAASVLIPDPASPPWDAVRSVAARAGVPVADLGRGDRLRVGEWRVEVVHPPPGAAARVADPNEASLVASASARGTTVLLTGDAESPQLAAATGPVDVLKVGHHGSADEGLPRLLARLRPRSALVSAGKGNRHGHPHPATLAALAAAGIAVLRTDRDGDLVVTPGARPGLG